MRTRMLLVSAIVSYNHASAIISSMQGQVKFLEEYAPEILWQPVVETSVLVNTNSEEFEKAVNSRLDDCATDMGDVVERALTTSPLLQFIKVAAQCLDMAEPIAVRLVDAVEQLKGNMSDLWSPHIHTASAQLEQAETRCPGCISADHKKRMDAFNDELTTVSASVDPLKTLRDKLKNANLKQYADKINQGPAVKMMLKGKVAELKKSLADFLDVGRELFNSTAEKYASSMNVTLDYLNSFTNETMSDHVKSFLPTYTQTVLVVLAIMGVVCGLYTIANQCSCSSSRTGLFSLHTGGWMLSGAVLFFLLTFTVPMLVSSASMVLGIAIERFVCHPLESPTAPECRHVLAFAHDTLIPQPQKKKQKQSSEALKEPVGGDGRQPEGDSGKLEGSVTDGVQRRVPDILEANADGPLGDLDASNVVHPVTRIPAHPLTESEESLHDIRERWIARRFQLPRLLAVSEETGGDVEDKSGSSYIVRSHNAHSVAHVSNRSRRPKLAVAFREDLSVGRRDTHVLLLSDFNDVEQVKGRHGGSGGLEGSATEFLPLLKDAVRGRPHGLRLQRDRRIPDGVFFSDDDLDVPVVHREAAESPEAYDDFIVEGDVYALNDTDSFPLPVDVKSYRRRPRGHPHLGEAAFRRRAAALPLWEDADAWASNTDSSIYVHQEVDRGVDDGNALLSWKRGVPFARPQSYDDDLAGVPGFSGASDTSFSFAVNEDSRGSEAKRRRGRRRWEVESSRSTFLRNESYGWATVWNGSRRLAKFESSYTSSSGRSIRRKHLHSRRDYSEAPPVDEDREKQVDDAINATLKLFTLDALVGILNRFQDCRFNKHSAFQLVGPDMAIDVISAFVGNSSPWLSVFEEQGAPPKFDAVEKMSADLSSLQLPAEVEGRLKGLNDDSLTPLYFDEIGRKAKQHVDDAVAALNGITTNMEKSLSESVRKVVDVCDEMQKALAVNQQTTFKEMLSSSLDQWSYLKRNFTAGLDGVKDMLPNVRKMVYSDIGAYFDHARVEVRENIGDCRPFYILYSKTVDAVCTQGFRRFGRWRRLKSVSTPFLTRPDDASSVANTDRWCCRQSTRKEAMDNYSDL
ncbi:hypothetical protein MRX96_013164 [Rhipicephalus microplus]